MERLSHECTFYPSIGLLAYALAQYARTHCEKLVRLHQSKRCRCVMQCEINRFVIGRENNVVRVDFSRDPDPPAPRFPGASGLREFVDESTSATKNISAIALSAAL